MRSFVDWVDAVAAGRRARLRRVQRDVRLDVRGRLRVAFAGRNPFGPPGLDLKALYLGRHLADVRRWADTTSDHAAAALSVEPAHTHLPLDDAVEQADMCRAICGAARRP